MKAKLIEKFEKKPNNAKVKQKFYKAFFNEVQKIYKLLPMTTARSNPENIPFQWNLQSEDGFLNDMDLQSVQKSINIDLFKLALIYMKQPFEHSTFRNLFFTIVEMFAVLFQTKYAIDFYLACLEENLVEIILNVYAANHFKFHDPDPEAAWAFKMSTGKLMYAIATGRQSGRNTKKNCYQKVLTKYIEKIVLEVDVSDIATNHNKQSFLKSCFVPLSRKTSFDEQFVSKFLPLMDTISKNLLRTNMTGHKDVLFMSCTCCIFTAIYSYDPTLLESYGDFNATMEIIQNINPKFFKILKKVKLRAVVGPRCGFCEKREEENASKKFKFCSACRKVYYCSKRCQKKHWKIHKLEC